MIASPDAVCNCACGLVQVELTKGYQTVHICFFYDSYLVSIIDVSCALLLLKSVAMFWNVIGQSNNLESTFGSCSGTKRIVVHLST